MFIDRDAFTEAKNLLDVLYTTSQPVLTLINSPYNAETTLFNLTVAGLSDNQNVKEKFLVTGCNKLVKLEKMRLYVGTHIVKGDTRGPVCGFCGTLCATHVKRQFSSGT